MGFIRPAYGKQKNIFFLKMDDAPLDYRTGFPQTLLNFYKGNYTEFVNTNCVISLCQPGRAAGFFGVLPMIHGSTDNDQGAAVDFTKSVFVDLARNGYIVGAFDKWFNGWGETNGGGYGTSTPRQPGIRKQFLQFGAPGYGNDGGYDISDGINTLVHKEGLDTSNYITDVMGDEILSFINDCNTNKPGTPWFIYWGAKFSHTSYTPPTRYATTDVTFTNNAAFGLDPSLPEYNQPGYIIEDADQNWTQADIDAYNLIHLNKHRCHLAGDDKLKQIIDLLASLNLLEETIIIICTDNAANVGEFRQQSAKGSMLKSANDSILYIRAPGAESATNYIVNDQSLSDMDVCATIYDVAGVAPNRPLNSTSLVPLLKDSSKRHRMYAPHYNLYKNSPCYKGLTKFDGTKYGKGTPFSYKNGQVGDAAGQEWSYAGSDTYNIYNLGPNKELSTALKMVDNAIAPWFPPLVVP